MPGASASPRPHQPASTGKRVLLVEDEPGLVLTLTDRLRKRGGREVGDLFHGDDAITPTGSSCLHFALPIVDTGAICF